MLSFPLSYSVLAETKLDCPEQTMQARAGLRISELCPGVPVS